MELKIIFGEIKFAIGDFFMEKIEKFCDLN